MVTLGDSSVSVCASAKFTVRSLNKDQQRGTAVRLGDIISDVHPQIRRTGTMWWESEDVRCCV